MRLANVLRRLSLIGGFLAAGYRLWYELAVVEANPFYVPPSGYRDTFGHALWINVSDLALACKFQGIGQQINQNLFQQRPVSPTGRR